MYDHDSAIIMIRCAREATRFKTRDETRPRPERKEPLREMYPAKGYEVFVPRHRDVLELFAMDTDKINSPVGTKILPLLRRVK